MRYNELSAKHLDVLFHYYTNRTKDFTSRGTEVIITNLIEHAQLKIEDSDMSMPCLAIAESVAEAFNKAISSYVYRIKTSTGTSLGIGPGLTKHTFVTAIGALTLVEMPVPASPESPKKYKDLPPHALEFLYLNYQGGNLRSGVAARFDRAMRDFTESLSEISGVSLRHAGFQLPISNEIFCKIIGELTIDSETPVPESPTNLTGRFGDKGVMTEIISDEDPQLTVVSVSPSPGEAIILRDAGGEHHFIRYAADHWEYAEDSSREILLFTEKLETAYRTSKVGRLNFLSLDAAVAWAERNAYQKPGVVWEKDDHYLAFIIRDDGSWFIEKWSNTDQDDVFLSRV